MSGDSTDVQPRCATKGEQGKLTWINTAFHGQQADTLGHHARLAVPGGGFPRSWGRKPPGPSNGPVPPCEGRGFEEFSCARFARPGRVGAVLGRQKIGHYRGPPPKNGH